MRTPDTHGVSLNPRLNADVKLDTEYDLTKPEELLAFLAEYGFNQTHAAEALGLTPNAISNRIRKLGIRQQVIDGKAKAKEQGFVKRKSVPLTQKKDRDKVARIRAKKRLKITDEVADATYKDLGPENVFAALVASGGVVEDAALCLECDQYVLIRIVARNGELADAIEAGFEEMKIEIRDQMLMAAQGRHSPSKEESSWMDKVGRYMMGLSEKKSVELSGGVSYRPESVPEIGVVASTPPIHLVQAVEEVAANEESD